MTAIAWIGSSLRETDNTALVRASQEHETVIPLYIIDDEHSMQKPGYSKSKFREDCLEELRETLRSHGSDIFVRRGHPKEVVQKLVRENDVDAVYRNKHYTPYHRNIRSELSENLQIPFNSFKDRVMFEEDEILTNSGTPYKVYSYYSKKWLDKNKRKPEKPEDFTSPDINPGRIPSPSDQNLSNEEMEVWEGGRSNGITTLKNFVDNREQDYSEKRDIASENGTSTLSPHLKFGTVSVREAYWMSEKQKIRSDSDEGYETWHEELAWRDYYMQILHNYPHEVEEPFMDKYRDNEPDWDTKEQSSEKWERWKNGRTGYPFVDAGMRQLKQKGWMHNRLRMVVTNFSCKDLWIDWRDVHDYFNRMFVDAEIASMVGGIQWSYSIGTDAQPYFRVFNPVSQGQRYDEEGKYIKRFVPELEDVPPEHVHEPWKMTEQQQRKFNCIIGEDYPEPIVDHDNMRKQSVSKFESLDA